MEEDIFHIHTFRCRHASDESDEEYVKAALALGGMENNLYGSYTLSGKPFQESDGYGAAS
ncbi:MAG: hypothetical protein K6G00_04150 [Treponema sp.]|nr:hypothetical protein [Treponema sp.]